MSDLSALFLAAAMAFLIGYWTGRADGQSGVAQDCRRLGAFYAQKQVFKCEARP